MKKSLLLLLLAIIVVSCSDDKEKTVTYKDVIGTYVGQCQVYSKPVAVGNPPYEYVETKNTTFQFTGTSNDNLMFIWEDITLPVEFTGGEDGTGWLKYHTTDTMYPRFQLDYHGTFTYMVFYLYEITETTINRYTFDCMKQ